MTETIALSTTEKGEQILKITPAPMALPTVVKTKASVLEQMQVQQAMITRAQAELAKLKSYLGYFTDDANKALDPVP